MACQTAETMKKFLDNPENKDKIFSIVEKMITTYNSPIYPRRTNRTDWKENPEFSYYIPKQKNNINKNDILNKALKLDKIQLQNIFGQTTEDSLDNTKKIILESNSWKIINAEKLIEVLDSTNSTNIKESYSLNDLYDEFFINNTTSLRDFYPNRYRDNTAIEEQTDRKLSDDKKEKLQHYNIVEEIYEEFNQDNDQILKRLSTIELKDQKDISNIPANKEQIDEILVEIKNNYPNLLIKYAPYIRKNWENINTELSDRILYHTYSVLFSTAYQKIGTLLGDSKHIELIDRVFGKNSVDNFIILARTPWQYAWLSLQTVEQMKKMKELLGDQFNNYCMALAHTPWQYAWLSLQTIEQMKKMKELFGNQY